MHMNEYQRHCATTAIYPFQGTMRGIEYLTIKLNGEAGEVAENVGKAMRDDDCVVTPERRYKLIKEMGDVLWYLAMLAKELDVELDDVATENILKLRNRKQHNTLHGSGDDR